jgi:hypothetical protein
MANPSMEYESAPIAVKLALNELLHVVMPYNRLAGTWNCLLDGSCSNHREEGCHAWL